MNEEMNYKRVVESLRLLVLNYNQQVKYFPEFVDIPFEILDTFEKAFILLPQVLESGKLTCTTVPNLIRLHILISLEFANPNFETVNTEEIGSSTEWNTIRELSKEVLLAMNEPLKEPNSEYL